jgi:prepilin-type N-terminal cleavage/methylation domain-containing protein
MKKKRILRNEKGFTLIEVIAVLIILGIMAAVAVPKYYAMADEAHAAAIDGALAKAVANFQLAVEHYRAVNKQDPASILALNIETNLGDFTCSYSGDGTNVTVTLDSGPAAWFADSTATKVKAFPCTLT